MKKHNNQTSSNKININYIYIMLASLCLGTMGVLVKLIGNEVHIMTLNFYRFFFGFIFLLFVVPFIDKNAFKITKKDAKEYFVVGIFFAISLSLSTSSIFYTSIQNAVFINYIYPFFVLFFAYFLLKEEITPTKVITLIIALVGLAIINPFEGGRHTFGNFLALLSAFFYAILITEMRKEDKKHSIGDVLWFLFFASLLLLPFPFIFGLGNLSKVFIYVLPLGFLSTGLAYLLYNLALEKIEADISSIISTMITPIFSVILAVIIIGEALSMRIIIGGSILILAGVYLKIHKKKKNEPIHGHPHIGVSFHNAKVIKKVKKVAKKNKKKKR